MTNVRDLITKEPSLVVGVILALLTLFGSFGLVLSEEQTAAVVLAVVAVMELVGFLIVRSQVYTLDSVLRYEDEALQTGVKIGRDESGDAELEIENSTDREIEVSVEPYGDTAHGESGSLTSRTGG